MPDRCRLDLKTLTVILSVVVMPGSATIVQGFQSGCRDSRAESVQITSGRNGPEPLAPAREIVRLRAGAHLYGTATPASDLDLKAVVLPGARDILLQLVAPTVSETSRPLAVERRGPGDVDVETHSLQRFLALLAAGQPIAVEMLFAPDAALTAAPDPLWREVQALGPRLLTRQAGVFVRYCRRQAELYGAKGARAAAARRALEALAAAEAAHGTQARLGEIAAGLEALAAATPHLALADIAVQDGRVVRHLDVCGRKAPFTATIRAARELAERVVAGYGQRALEAERQEGVDWKALSHAVRVGREAIELLGTGRLCFPLASAPRLLAIKLGQVPYGEVVDEVEAVLAEVEAAQRTSSLPEAPDLAAAEALVVHAHRRQVCGGEDA